jgi:hypothetical protein
VDGEVSVLLEEGLVVLGVRSLVFLMVLYAREPVLVFEVADAVDLMAFTCPYGLYDLFRLDH